MKTKTFAASLFALGAALLTASVAHATIFSGTAQFNDNGPTGNGLLFGGATNNAAISNLNLSLNTQTTIDNFVAITSNDSNNSFFGTTATDNISEAFSFTLPDNNGGVLDGTGTETVGWVSGVSGTISWSDPLIIDFTDGAVLSVSLSTAQFNPYGGANQTVYVNATLEMTTAPVPEPVSLALLGVGLAGVGMVRRRRRAA